MRIEKLAASVAMTRKEFKKAMSQGRVTVNGVYKKGGSVDINPDTDMVELDGKRIVYTEFVYIMLHKPAGVISATEDPRQQTVIDILPEKYKKYALFPVGRLDIDTEGLLLITNDGQTAHKLLTPNKNVFKTYFVITDEEVTREDADRMQEGILLDDGYMTKPAIVRVYDDKTHSSISITEGKFHQVKRMYAAVGKKVLYLKRTEFGGLCLDESLEKGECRELTEAEVEKIKNIMQNC